MSAFGKVLADATDQVHEPRLYRLFAEGVPDPLDARRLALYQDRVEAALRQRGQLRQVMPRGPGELELFRRGEVLPPGRTNEEESQMVAKAKPAAADGANGTNATDEK